MGVDCFAILLITVCYFGGGFTFAVVEALVLDVRPLPTHQPRCSSTFSSSRTAEAAAVFNHEHPASSTASPRTSPSTTTTTISTSRRCFFRTAAASMVMAGTVAGGIAVTPPPAWARYILDEETGDYVEIQDVPWQTEWKQRLDKASTMTQSEIFEAARGAGNTNLKTGPESDASRKRRALSACRDKTVRDKTGLVSNEKECTARVLAGEIDFILDVL